MMDMDTLSKERPAAQIVVITQQVDGVRAGFCFGILSGFMHLAWALIVAAGYGQVLLDYIYGLHFLSTPFKVQSFDITTTLLLIVVSSLGGFLMAYFFAKLWNTLSVPDRELNL